MVLWLPPEIPHVCFFIAVQVGVKVPLVVRLEGTNVELGKKIILDAGISNLISADDLDDAAKKAVASIQ